MLIPVNHRQAVPDRSGGRGASRRRARTEESTCRGESATRGGGGTGQTVADRVRRSRSSVVKEDIVVFMSEPLMILVAGPYRSGTNDDRALIKANVDAMTDTALKLFRMGHLPVLGEWFALPLIEHAGSRQIGDEIFDEIFHPISRELVVRCDACLRIGGPSKGADEMVSLARTNGKNVFLHFEEVPPGRDR
jgi:hypothetical protein